MTQAACFGGGGQIWFLAPMPQTCLFWWWQTDQFLAPMAQTACGGGGGHIGCHQWKGCLLDGALAEADKKFPSCVHPYPLNAITLTQGPLAHYFVPEEMNVHILIMGPLFFCNRPPDQGIQVDHILPFPVLIFGNVLSCRTPFGH